MKNQEKCKYVLVGTLLGMALTKGISLLRKKIEDIDMITSDEEEQILDTKNSINSDDNNILSSVVLLMDKD